MESSFISVCGKSIVDRRTRQGDEPCWNPLRNCFGSCTFNTPNNFWRLCCRWPSRWSSTARAWGWPVVISNGSGGDRVRPEVHIADDAIALDDDGRDMRTAVPRRPCGSPGACLALHTLMQDLAPRRGRPSGRIPSSSRFLPRAWRLCFYATPSFCRHSATLRMGMPW